MVCTTTTILERRSRQGLTLVEMMVAAGVSSLIFILAAAMVTYTGRHTASLADYVDLDNSSRFVADRMANEIRQANRLASYSTNWLTFEMIDAATGGTNHLIYSYDTDAGTLSRCYQGTTNVLLDEIKPGTLAVAVYQRNPVLGSLEQYATMNATEGKVVQFSWVCSRSVLGRLANTESRQSFKVMIRKP